MKERGVAMAQAARGLDVQENVLRKWLNEAVGRSRAGVSLGWMASRGPCP